MIRINIDLPVIAAILSHGGPTDTVKAFCEPVDHKSRRPTHILRHRRRLGHIDIQVRLDRQRTLICTALHQSKSGP